jgi:menaquinone-dependent protoporphyrinogen oxidase
MHIATVYATVEGQTRRIAEHVAERLRAEGHVADLASAERGGRDAIAAAEAAILLGPVHGGRYPAPLVHLAREEAARLNAIPSAFVSVSLGIMGEAEERCEAEGFPSRLAEASGWHPGAVHHAAGALRFAEYDFFKRWIMRRIARSHGYGEGDREFTDWDALDTFLAEWLTGCEAGRAPGG